MGSKRSTSSQFQICQILYLRAAFLEHLRSNSQDPVGVGGTKMIENGTEANGNDDGAAATAVACIMCLTSRLHSRVELGADIGVGPDFEANVWFFVRTITSIGGTVWNLSRNSRSCKRRKRRVGHANLRHNVPCK